MANLDAHMKKEKGAMATDNFDLDVAIMDKDYSLLSTTNRFNTTSTQDYFSDSGATRHMTDQRNAISNFTSVCNGSWSVNGIGSSSYAVEGYGDVDKWSYVNGVRKASIF